MVSPLLFSLWTEEKLTPIDLFLRVSIRAHLCGLTMLTGGSEREGRMLGADCSLRWGRS